MFFVHPGAAHGAISRCLANGWAALGTCGLYSNGRNEIFRALGLLAPNSIPTYCAAMLTDTAYGFLLNVPGFMLNYALSGCGLLPSVIMGIKASAAVCWTSSISGGLFDTFHALDSGAPHRKARVPILARWIVVDRFELRVRKKIIWICLVSSIAATAAIYCFAPGGFRQMEKSPPLAGMAGNPGRIAGTGSSARFFWPSGIAVDSVENVYVADTYNDTIRKITSNGEVTTLAGSPQNPRGDYGSGSVARFFHPNGVAVDTSDNIYVADTGNNTIRLIALEGTVLTFAASIPE